MKILPGFMRFVATGIVLLLLGAMGWTQQSVSAQASQQGAAATSKQPAANGMIIPAAPSVPSVSGEQSGVAATPAEPLIGPGDLLKVGVLGAPDYDQEIRVSGSGDAVLALVGAVHVAGLTPEQAQQTIRQKLIAGGFFNDPQVTVLEKEYATQGVSVLGEVQKPGVYPIMGPRRLFDALSLAGGTTPKAGQAVTITHRNEPNKPETVHLSNNPQDNALANVSVTPGDTIVVSKAGIVYVVGDVHKPTGVIMDNNGTITVLQAIAMAEGVNPTAALDHTKIIRKASQGQQQQEIPIQLKKILASKKPDLQLRADDILFVPSSAAKSVFNRSVNAAVSLAASVVAYRTVY
jgi:polysaccharide export outer membrane protein